MECECNKSSSCWRCGLSQNTGVNLEFQEPRISRVKSEEQKSTYNEKCLFIIFYIIFMVWEQIKPNLLSDHFLNCCN